jgi:hypothetical protein
LKPGQESQGEGAQRQTGIKNGGRLVPRKDQKVGGDARESTGSDKGADSRDDRHQHARANLDPTHDLHEDMRIQRNRAGEGSGPMLVPMGQTVKEIVGTRQQGKDDERAPKHLVQVVGEPLSLSRKVNEDLRYSPDSLHPYTDPR